jgi:hypothetical protein
MITRAQIGKTYRRNGGYTDRVPTAVHITDWMRLFPGVRPRWMSTSEMSNLAYELGVFRELKDADAENYDWGDMRAIEFAKNKLQKSLNIRYVVEDEDLSGMSNLDVMERAPGRSLRHEYVDTRAPKPGKLYHMVKLLEERGLVVDYKETLETWDGVIYFKRLTSGLKLRLAKAKGFIEPRVFFGEVYGSYSDNTDKKGVRVRFFDADVDEIDSKTKYDFTFDTVAALREHLISLLGGRKEYYILLIKIYCDMWCV